MTTNAILLPRLARPLAEAGLRRVNVHVDTLDPERLKKLMRFGTVEEIEAGIAAAEDAGLLPIKINCVVTRDYNDEDVVDLARRARERGWHVRFIELMPLGGGETAHLALSQFVPSRETRERIETALGPLCPVPNASPADESRNFRFAEGAGVVGFISPVSEPYCGACNRMRLTADGKLPPLPAQRRRAGREGARSARARATPRWQSILARAVAAEAHGSSPRRGNLDRGPLDVPDRRLTPSRPASSAS